MYGNWGDQLLDLCARNVVPFLSDIGFQLLSSLGSSLLYFSFYDASSVFSVDEVCKALPEKSLDGSIYCIAWKLYYTIQLSDGSISNVQAANSKGTLIQSQIQASELRVYKHVLNCHYQNKPTNPGACSPGVHTQTHTHTHFCLFYAESKLHDKLPKSNLHHISETAWVIFTYNLSIFLFLAKIGFPLYL